MNYSQASISNLALGRIGARGQITDINENSPNAVKVLNCWDAIFQEVLSERDWKFAKVRTELQLSTSTPLYGYRYAWPLPGDLLRFVRPTRKPRNRSEFAWLWGPEGWGWYSCEDPPFWPGGWPYKVEQVVTSPATQDTSGNTIAAGYTKCAITDYGGQRGAAKINYIQLITDYTQLMPGFVNALAWRLAQELSISITEDKNKFEMCGERYKDGLNSAEAQNETADTSEDETGDFSWERAGRYAGGRW